MITLLHPGDLHINYERFQIVVAVTGLRKSDAAHFLTVHQQVLIGVGVEVLTKTNYVYRT